MRIYDMAPPTARPADELAQMYGYATPQHLALSLPQGARVADIGAGSSPFGSVIGGMRPDISWQNVDNRYDNTARIKPWRPVHPMNVSYVAGDVVRQADNFPIAPGSLDRVYSSALLPHIIMSSRQEGTRAVHTMAQLLRPGGSIALTGFNNSKRIAFTAEAYAADPDQAAEMTVDTLQLSRGDAFLQRLDNVASWVTKRSISLANYIPSQPY